MYLIHFHKHTALKIHSVLTLPFNLSCFIMLVFVFFFAGSLLLTGAMSFLTSSELLGLETDLWCGYHIAWVVSTLPD